MSKIISLNEAKKRLIIKHRNEISIISDYTNISNKCLFKCNICEHQWYAIAKSVITAGNGCPICGLKRGAKSQAHSYDFIKEFIKSQNYILLSRKYENNRSKLEFKCPKGHIFKMRFDCFYRRNQRCPICSHKQGHLLQRKPERIYKLLEDNNLKFIAFPDEYINWKSPIVFECECGHISTKTIADFIRRSTCVECTKIKMSEGQKGSRGNNWQGGITYLGKSIKPKMIEWQEESMKNCNYRCVVTGKYFDNIHHLYSFNLILKEAIFELGLDYRKKLGNYTDEDLINITNKTIELHKKYPLGVCVTHKVHVLFHQIYGKQKNTPEQFYDFLDKIKNKEIVIE